TPITFNITLPYPWIVSGAQPVHAYDSRTVTTSGGQSCITPGKLIYSGPLKISYPSKSVVGVTQSSSAAVKVPLPATGFIYLDIHVDYGLVGSGSLGKGPLGGFIDAKTLCGVGAISVVLIPGKQGYSFGAT